MSLCIQTIPNAQRSKAKIHDALTELAAGCEGAVFITSSLAVAARYRKLWASEPFAFGLRITTLSAWLTDRWELYGDGSRLVAPLQRKLMLHQAMSTMVAEGAIEMLALSPGTITMLARMAQEGLPCLIGDRVPDEPLTPAEKEALAVLAHYANSLEKRGLCEQCQAIAALTEIEWPVQPLIIEAADEPSFLEMKFFEALGNRTSVFLYRDGRSLPVKTDNRAKELVELQLCLFEPDLGAPVGPTGAVRFLLPSGRYAEALLIAENIVEYTLDGNRLIALGAREPLRLFKEIAPLLVSHDIGVTVSGRKTFAQTDFGRLWLTLLQFFEEGPFSTFQASDAAASPFSGIPKHQVYRLDASWRGDRTCTKERCIADLSSASEVFARVFPLLEEGLVSEAIDVFEGVAKKGCVQGDALRAEQMSAIGCARDYGAFARDLGFGAAPPVGYLQDALLAVEARTYSAQDAPRHVVDIMALDGLAKQDPCSYETVIITDLDNLSYPIRDERDAADRLFMKYAIFSRGDALEAARLNFFRALSVPAKRLVCERILNTADAQPAYPAVMLEELLDCYRADLLSTEELDKATGLPKNLKRYAEMAGEGRLYRNLAVTELDQEIQAYEDIAPHGVLREESRAKIVVPSTGDASGKGGFSLSPSAIESYLECPYKWFALRRLRLEGLDAGFGPLEMGSFSHSLLKSFYLTFQKQGFSKVAQDTLGEAQALLDELFDQHIAFQADLKRGDNPLIPLTSFEEEEVLSLKKRLIRYLDREAVLLPGFVPRHFEYGFGNDGSFAFAGGTLHGSIDRIDVNGKGQAVIIDYKGSVSSDYVFGSQSEIPWAFDGDQAKGIILPHKVQALLYAQAARKELGLDVVAAVYVSYGRDARIAGIFDRQVLGPAELLGIDEETCGVGGDGSCGLDDVLDETEESIGRALQKLAEGYIEPYPRGKDPCGYCPVTACEARKTV